MEGRRMESEFLTTDYTDGNGWSERWGLGMDGLEWPTKHTKDTKVGGPEDGVTGKPEAGGRRRSRSRSLTTDGRRCRKEPEARGAEAGV